MVFVKLEINDSVDKIANIIAVSMSLEYSPHMNPVWIYMHFNSISIYFNIEYSVTQHGSKLCSSALEIVYYFEKLKIEKKNSVIGLSDIKFDG